MYLLLSVTSGGSRGVSAETPFRSRKAADDRHIAHAQISKGVRGWGSKERMTCAHETRDIPTAGKLDDYA